MAIQTLWVPFSTLNAPSHSPSTRLIWILHRHQDTRLRTLSGLDPKTMPGPLPMGLRRAAAELVTTGWLAITQQHRKSPLHFTLCNPVAAQLRARIFSIRRRVRGARHRGEALMREFLTLRVALNHYEENAAPDFLLNPYTGELLELDRYYPTAAVGFEFNGIELVIIHPGERA